ncbi:MAG TPA: hypothetical protein DD635_06970 [Flavobacteriales bacterium]|nr:hypothetical protein [Flavobacteriales bacterium]
MILFDLNFTSILFRPSKEGLFQAGLLCSFLIVACEGFAQNRYLTVGTGATPMSLAGDYRSLGWNPSHITFSPLLDSNWNSAAGGFEMGMRLSAVALEREDVWDAIWNRSKGETEDWDTNAWSDYVNLLSNERIAINADVVSAAWAKKWNNWGIAYSNTQHFQVEAFFSDETLALLIQGGSQQWTHWFDAFVTYSGDTLPNNGGFSADQLLDFNSGLNLDGDALLSEILDDTKLGFSWHRSHCLGLSKAWEIGELTLHTGVSGRLLLGSGYFSIQNTEDGFDAFGAFANGFNVSSIAALSSGLPTEFEQLRTWGPVGQGWALDFGGVLEWEDKAWGTVSITDIGNMEWRGEQYNFNSLISNWSTPVSEPTNILDLVIGAMDPNTWFDAAEYQVRTVPHGITFQLGGGVRVGPLLTLAAEASFDNPDLIGNPGARLGATAVVTPVRFLRGDIGISKWGNETTRVPAGLMVKTGKRGFECGIQASDIQALWKSSQPEVGFRMVAMRWVW